MKILVEMLHGLGDTVCALPMLKAVRNNYSEAEIVVITKGKANIDIINASHIKIDKVIDWNIYGDSIIKTIKNIIYLRKQNFDIGINSANTPVKKARIFMKVMNCKRKIGLQHEFGKYIEDYDDNLHFVDANLLAIKNICDIEGMDKQPHLYPDKATLEFIERRFRTFDDKPIVGVCIGNADYSLRNRLLRTGKVFTRGWGIENMQQLLKKLLIQNYNIILIGGKLEKRLIQQLDNAILKNKNIINFVNKTNIIQSIALVSKCDVVVGVDTGMQHIADAVGAKTISIFGPTNPKTHGAYSYKAVFVEAKEKCKYQYCYGSRLYVECNERKCLKNISVDEVMDKIILNLKR